MVQINVDGVDTKLRKKFKILCAEHDTSMNAEIIKFVEEKVKRWELEKYNHAIPEPNPIETASKPVETNPAPSPVKNPSSHVSSSKHICPECNVTKISAIYDICSECFKKKKGKK